MNLSDKHERVFLIFLINIKRCSFNVYKYIHVDIHRIAYSTQKDLNTIKQQYNKPSCLLVFIESYSLINSISQFHRISKF